MHEHSTKQDILSFLLRQGQGKAQDLAEALNISPQATRRHLKDLQTDGLIVFHSIASGMGRPQHVYQLSPKGREQFPNQYDEFVISFLDTLVNNLGYEQASDILQKHWQRKSLSYRQQLGDGSLPERVAKLVELRRQEGYMAEFQSVDEPLQSFILTEHNCAIAQVANSFPTVCGHELEMFATALGDCQVQRTHSIVAGEHLCGYLISPKVTVTADSN
jgi:DeoR family transcriptional regulator, suf operon transcriptional repressor